MSLSVEDLKTVLAEFEIGNLAIFDDSDRPARGADRIVQAALRECITITEAEPVAYGLLQDGEVFAFSSFEPHDVHAKLIRKPE